MGTTNFKKLVKIALLAGALVTTVVACGNKNKDNQTLNAFQQGCSSGCDNVSSIPFFSVQTTAQSMYYYGASNAMKLSLSFAGQNQQTSVNSSNQQYNPYASPAMNYSGRVSAIGTMSVTQPLNLGFCPQVPAGQYSLSTQTAGQWNQGQISGMRFVISGAVAMTATLLNAQASESMYQYSSSTRLYGTLQIEQVNGYYCQGASYYLY